MCKISQLAEKNTGQLAIRRAYRTGALFFIIRAYSISTISSRYAIYSPHPSHPHLLTILPNQKRKNQPEG